MLIKRNIQPIRIELATDYNNYIHYSTFCGIMLEYFRWTKVFISYVRMFNIHLAYADLEYHLVTTTNVWLVHDESIVTRIAGYKYKEKYKRHPQAAEFMLTTKAIQWRHFSLYIFSSFPKQATSELFWIISSIQI